MQVKCEYCGGYLEDTEELCPHCGGVNKYYLRNAPDTPQTIGELQAWYAARNLPPYDVTRFFIGEDYRYPKAFGIYKDGSKYVVYKNKADGTRAIRYEGTDEAYAVNELYLRLKEEILHQKSSGKTKENKKIYKTKAGRKRRSCLGFLIRFAIILAAAVVIPAGIVTNEISLPENYRYYFTQDNAYYCVDNSSYEWWKYDESTGDYSLYEDISKQALQRPKKCYPDGISKWNTAHGTGLVRIYDELYPGGNELNQFYKKYNINHSKAFVDAGHHRSPSQSGYYVVGNKVYYYLHYRNTSSNNDDGWYRFKNNEWSYYSWDLDHDALGDELWYDYDEYYVGESLSDYKSGEIYNYYGDETWIVNDDVFDFEDTEYYVKENYDYRPSYDSSDSYRDDSDYWSDNDNDYDWDSGSDSWDSGSTDWDSDW